MQAEVIVLLVRRSTATVLPWFPDRDRLTRLKKKKQVTNNLRMNRDETAIKNGKRKETSYI